MCGSCGWMNSGRRGCPQPGGDTVLDVLKTLVAYRLIDPGSEWRLHREWYRQSAMADLLGADFGLAHKDKLYGATTICCCTRRICSASATRWKSLFGANFEVLLYDLTSTYFEISLDPAEGGKRRYGYSRDKRLGLPAGGDRIGGHTGRPALAYEVMPGNTADKHDAADFLARIERQYGRRRRIWVMDRGIPTEAVLAEMRGSPSRRSSIWWERRAGVSGNWSRNSWPSRGRRSATGVQVKLVEQDNELYVFAASGDASARNARCAGGSSSG